MQLFSDPLCPQCHRIRIVLAAKETQCRITSLDEPGARDDLAMINPAGTAPAFTDRNMVLSEPRIIMEYLDDRYPHPPLMPVDPIGKAQAREWLLGIERSLYEQLPGLRSQGKNKSAEARRTMLDFFAAAAAALRQSGEVRFFLGDNPTLLDASLAPILWRLHAVYRLELPKGARQTLINKYAKGLYAQPLFQRSLTDPERELNLGR